MKRFMLEQHLRWAEELVARGRQHIAQQMAIVAELDQHRHNSTEAGKLLEVFQSQQESHEADHERLKKELANLDESGSSRSRS